MSMKHKKIIMISLGAIFVLSMIYRITHPYRQERVAQLTYSGKSVAHTTRAIKQPQASGMGKTSGQSMLKIGLLSNPPRHSNVVHADIFNPQRSAKKASDIEASQDMAPKPDVAVTVVESPVERIKRQLGNFNFLGSYSSAGKDIVFLGRGKQLLAVRKGDRIDGKYRIEAVTEKMVILRDDSIAEPIMIEFSEL